MSRFCILLALCFGCGPAPFTPPTYEAEPAAPVASEPAERPIPIPAVANNPFFWTVRSGESVSYLFGTLHSGVSLDHAFPASAYPALDEARVILLEAGPSAVSLADLRERAQLPRGETLTTQLSAGTWHRLANELHTTLHTNELEPLRPWVPMLLLLQGRLSEMRGVGESMDITLATYVGEQSLNHRVLETAGGQYEALEALPDSSVVSMIESLLDEPAGVDRRLRRVVSAYRSGELSQVSNMLDDDDQRALVSMVYDRGSPEWMAEVEAELATGGAFVALGVGHLAGADGLLVRLRGAGFDVDRGAP